MPTNWKDRIVELRRVPASELKAHPENWRKHAAHQKRALSAMLEQVGIVDAVIARQCEDGSLQLIDGHLRQELGDLEDQQLPVLVLDVTEAEAEEILATYHPIGDMAQTDTKQFEELIKRVRIQDDELERQLRHLAKLDEAPATEVQAQYEIVPEFSEQYNSVMILCSNAVDWAHLQEVLNLQPKACRFNNKRVGLCTVVTHHEFFRRLEELTGQKYQLEPAKQERANAAD